MFSKNLLLSALSATCVQAIARCGSKEPSAAHVAISKALAAEEANTLETFTTTDVDVYFHVVAASTSPSDGYIPVRTPEPRVYGYLADVPHRRHNSRRSSRSCRRPSPPAASSGISRAPTTPSTRRGRMTATSWP